MGSKYNLLIEWENGERTAEPLAKVLEDAPYEVALYAMQNKLLDKLGCKRCKRFARMQNRFTAHYNIKFLKRQPTKAKTKAFRRAPKYKCRYEVPYNYEDSVRLDKENKNTKWADAWTEEFDKLDEYELFKDIGDPKKGANYPAEYKKIQIYVIYDVKNDGRHQARVVANGHLTPESVNESVYSGVVTLRRMKTVMFLAELNGLKLWNTDIQSAYLNFTQPSLSLL